MVKYNQGKGRAQNQKALNGYEVDFDVMVNIMDDEIREELHNKLAPCTDQEFADAYVAAHEAKYGEQFEI